MTLNRPLLHALAVPVVLLIGSLALVQWHSIAFWSHASGVELGWLWSLLIEAAALWLWFITGRPVNGWAAQTRRWALRGAAVVATALLLAGLLYQVSRPVWSDVTQRAHEAAALAERRQRTAAEIVELRREAGELERTLAQFRANSAERVGWLGAIESTQAALGQNQARVRELLGGAGTVLVPLSWLGYAVVGMQALALLLFQLVNILAITTVARRLEFVWVFRPSPTEMHQSDADRSETAISEIPETAETPEPQFGHLRGVAAETAAALAARIPTPEGAAVSIISAASEPKSVSVSPAKFDVFTLKALRDRVQLALDGGAMTRNEFCQAYDLSPVDLSCFFALFDKEKRSERKPSRKSVERLMTLFAPPKEQRWPS